MPEYLLPVGLHFALLYRDTRLHPRWRLPPPFEPALRHYVRDVQESCQLVRFCLYIEDLDEFVHHSLIILGLGNVSFEGVSQILGGGENCVSCCDRWHSQVPGLEEDSVPYSDVFCIRYPIPVAPVVLERDTYVPPKK